MTQKQFDDENKEEFCGACLTVPLAFAAGGGGIAGSSTFVNKKNKKMKNVLFVVGIVIAFLSISYSVYVLYKQRTTTGLAVCSQ
jgi:uncharacterized membrane protein YebE (DUF533 family)